MFKHFSAILIMLCLSSFLAAQTDLVVYNDGLTSNIIESGMTVTILGGYVSQTNAVDGTIDNQGVIQFTGNWANNNTNSTNVFSTSAGLVNFIGTTEQTVSGTDTTQFYNVEVNNTASTGGVTVSKIAEIENTLLLTDGVVTTASSSPLVMKSSSSSSSGSDASHVDGPMRKEGTTAFDFPLGNLGVWARLGIGTPASSTTFESQYFYSAYSNTLSMAASPTPVLNNVSTEEYWNLTQYEGTGSVVVDLHWENADRSYINSCSDLKLGRWNGSAWENTYNTSGSGTCSGTGSGYISSSIDATSFVGALTFASISVDDAVNPLPIQLLSFEANINEDHVDLTWVTSTEINNDYFTVERSVDGVNWEEVLVAGGAGNSNHVINYVEVDYEPLEGLSYYRLIQTDFDGKFESFNVVPVKFESKLTPTDGVLSLFPNPISAGELVHVKFENIYEEEVLVVMRDVRGREFYSKMILNVEEGELIGIPVDLAIPPGVYLIIATSENQIYSQKLVVQ